MSNSKTTTLLLLLFVIGSMPNLHSSDFESVFSVNVAAVIIIILDSTSLFRNTVFSQPSNIQYMTLCIYNEPDPRHWRSGQVFSFSRTRPKYRMMNPRSFGYHRRTFPFSRFCPQYSDTMYLTKFSQNLARFVLKMRSYDQHVRQQ